MKHHIISLTSAQVKNNLFTSTVGVDLLELSDQIITKSNTTDQPKR